MIKSLHLINCQSHKNSLIEFHPGLNVITGDTDSGKSVIIRGLDKVIYNNFPSKELVSHWGGHLSIAVTVNNNIVILKHDKKDSYTLNDTPFSAIGGKVPEEIRSVFNMEDINLQNQIDSFFLLTDTSGYVASYLNQIANLSQIDSTTTSIKSELNGIKRTIEHDKENLVEKEKVLQSYSFLTDLKTSINEADELEQNIVDLSLKIDSITLLLDKVKEIDDKFLKNEKLLSLKGIVNETLKDIKLIDTLDAKIYSLSFELDKVSRLDFQINDLNKLSHLKPLLNEISEVEKKKSILSTKLDSLDVLIHKTSTIDRNIKIAISNRLKERSIYDSEMKKLNKCFFCGSKLN